MDRRNTSTTPEELLSRFGGRMSLARDGIGALLDALDADGLPAFARWKESFVHCAGQAVEKLPSIGKRYSVCSVEPAAMIFAMQTYYAMVVEAVVERSAPGRSVGLLPEGPFTWPTAARSKSLGRFLDRLRREVENRDDDTAMDDGPRDLFKPLYQDIFPRALRRRLGEYYTPDWLADHVLDRVGYSGDPAARLLDPSCGSGTFLVQALRRLKTSLGGQFNCHPNRAAVPATAKQQSPVPRPPSPAPRIVGFDLNPLAVLTARANYLLAAADLLPDLENVEIPVYLRNSILDERDDHEPFDFVVGNPPWIAWDNLPEEDRRATKPLWKRYGLFSLSGNAARHGGGKKDLSMLMLYATADRYLKEGGRLGMVITQTAFQSVGAGDGFRRFRIGADGAHLQVERVDDLTALRPFADAANWTSTIVLRKGAATQYPVPYMEWGERREERKGKREERGEKTTEECFARPIDPNNLNSPWLVLPKNSRPPLAVLQSAPAYTAHIGANSGGANGVYWLEVLENRGDVVLVRNMASKGKRRVERIEAEIEPDLLYPLLRWGDVERYRAEPRAHILLAQDPQTRSGIDEVVMRERYPRTFAYLERFRELLVARSAYRRYQQRGPFYSMYNVGPYTVAPIKVVWRRMDRRINAAVVEMSEARPPVAALWPKPPVPQETCVLVACETSDEAHYLCATLNSQEINELAVAHGIVGGKSFGSPGMLKYLPIERFDPSNPRHMELSRLSRASHEL